MSKTNDNKQPVAVERKQPQAAPPPNEVFIRVGTTLYKVVDQPTITGVKGKKAHPMEHGDLASGLRQGVHQVRSQV